MHAAWGQDPDLKEGQLEVAKLLLEQGIVANHQDIGGDYPLLFAAFTGNYGVIKAICDARPAGGDGEVVDPDLQNMSGHTALMITINQAGGQVDNMKSIATLLSAGASVTIENKEERNAHSLALENSPKEVQELIKLHEENASCDQLCAALCSEGETLPPFCRGWDDGSYLLAGGSPVKCELNDDESGCLVMGGDCVYKPQENRDAPDQACVAACKIKHDGKHGCGDTPAALPKAGRRKRANKAEDKEDL